MMLSAVNEFLDELRGGRMSENPIVKVEQGQVQGKVVNTPAGKPYYSFQGIPYAKPPLGSLRFKAPEPAEPWDEVRDAGAEGNVSAQIDPFFHKEYIGDENCLFLNVYTPNLDGEFLPVMLFIHGGGYKFGSGNTSLYGADYLVEKDVVVVTINYRCGPLGFLCLNTPEVPGNAGLKDMVLAIKWVKENIGSFGGNSGNLTIFGESAGGAAVSTLSACPLTKDLVNKVIIQSGSALGGFAFQKKPLENAKKLAEFLGCESNDSDDILEFLRATPVREIVEADNKLHPLEKIFQKDANIFAPVVEKEFPGTEAAFTENFVDLLTTGRVSKVPVMIGRTGLEIFKDDMVIDDLRMFIPEDFNIDMNSEEAVSIVEQIRQMYFQNDEVSKEDSIKFSELLSDSVVNVDTHRYVKYLVQNTVSSVYYYIFDYVGELNISNKLQISNSPSIARAGHMDELGYLFKNSLQKDVEPTPQDVKMRERMVRLWTNFAKSGNPTPDDSDFIPVTWLPVTKDIVNYMNLSNELFPGTNPDHEKMAFWEQLYNKYYKIWELKKPSEEVFVTTEKIETQNDSGITEEDSIQEAQEEIADKLENIVVTNEVIETIVDTIVDEILNEPGPITEPEPEPTKVAEPETVRVAQPEFVKVAEPAFMKPEVNGKFEDKTNGGVRTIRPSNEIKVVTTSNGAPKDVIRANDPPEDDLPKNIGINKFVNFFESLGKK